MILNFLFIPVIITHLGKEAFGLIIFSTVLLGYFQYFDLGITDSLTKYVAQYKAESSKHKSIVLINTSVFLFLIIGLVICISVISLVFSSINLAIVFNVENEIDFNNLLIISGVLSIFSWPLLAIKSTLLGFTDHFFVNVTLAIFRIVSVLLAYTAYW